MRRYSISGGDDGAYGPSFGPVSANEIGHIDGPEGSRALLLRLAVPIERAAGDIEYLVVRPRYTGQTLADVQEEGCVVGIWCVPADVAESMDDGVSLEDCEYWAIGNCRPS